MLKTVLEEERLLTKVVRVNRSSKGGGESRIAEASRLLRMNLKNGHSSILFTHLGPAKIQPLIPRESRSSYAIFLHGAEVWRRLSALERNALGKATLLLSNSSFTAEKVERRNPWLRRPIKSIPLALPFDKIPAHTETSSEPVVLMVGTLSSSERYKGHDEMLNIWREVIRVVPEARLIIAGGGDDLSRLKAKARPHGSSVVFTGQIGDKQLKDLYRMSRLFAMPSKGEGFGIAYLEAMAHGKPCIASVHDAGREVVEDGRTGLVVDQDDAVELRESLVRLLTDVSYGLALGSKGRKRVLEYYNLDRFKSDLLRALRPLL
ncbi:MAG: glycosyltransferase family 4 protein [Candidatus Neomarinimicrobiota bacterium]